MSEAFYTLCGRAKVPMIRFHDTRHSCGTLLHVQGADPFIIQKVLGHSQLSTTRRYTHVPVEVTKAAVTGLESLFEEEEKRRAGRTAGFDRAARHAAGPVDRFVRRGSHY